LELQPLPSFRFLCTPKKKIENKGLLIDWDEFYVNGMKIHFHAQVKGKTCFAIGEDKNGKSFTYVKGKLIQG